MSGGQIMIVAIVALVVLGRIMASHTTRGDPSRLRSRHGFQPQIEQENGEKDAMREEIRTLKDRIQVLERIATDNNASSVDVGRQIEALRDK